MKTEKRKWFENLFGLFGGPTTNEEKVNHSSFSEFFPWKAYNPNEDFYYMRDNSVCWIFECDPLVMATPATYETLSNLYKINFPQKTILQFVLYSDPYIEEVLTHFGNLREHNPDINPVFLGQMRNYQNFLRISTGGLKQFQGTPVKNYRLFFSIKIPVDIDFATDQDGWFNEACEHQDLVLNAIETVKSSGIRRYPLKPKELINTMYRILNPDLEIYNLSWDETKPINKQLIYSDTSINVEGSFIKTGSRYTACLTPKVFPKDIPWTLVKNLIGYTGKGATSDVDDMNQIMVPYIYTLSVIIEDTSSIVDAKAMLSFAQKSKGTSAVNVNSRQTETMWLLSQKEQNEKIIKILPQLILMHEDEKTLKKEISHVKALWENLGCPAQLEAKYLVKKMFVSAFPGGLYAEDYDATQRLHLVPTLAAGYLTPVEAGFQGVGLPYMLFLDRRGQISSIDIFKTADNKNFLVTGGSGGGKSFLCNYMMGSYLATGAKVRIIDVGRSYEKLCQKVGGQFIIFSGSNLVINFFEAVDELDGDTLAMLVSIIMTMAYSRTGGSAQEHEMALIELAISNIFAAKGKSTTIDDIADYLSNLDKHFNTDSVVAGSKYETLIQSGAALATALEKYTSRGTYGKYFYGKSSVSFTKDFVTVELDGTSEELRRVVVLAFSMIIENEIYNGDRKRPTIVLLDEAWQTLDNPVAGKFAEGLYRKARKYFASIGICLQSVIDAAEGGKLGAIGTVAKGQSAFHIALPDDGLDAGRDTKVINVDDYTFNNIFKKMPKNSKPNYSEFTLTISNSTVVPLRLVVDSYSYFLYTSDSDDNNCLAALEEAYSYKNRDNGDVGAKALEKASEYAALHGIPAFRANIKNIVEGIRNESI